MPRVSLVRSCSLAVAAFLAACSSSPPAPAVALLAVAPAPPTASALPSPNPGPSAHERGVAAALARVPKIAEQVAAIRHLALKHPVVAAEQSQDDFKHYLDVEIKKELPAPKAAASVRALVRLGLLSAPIDLGATVENAMITQAGAYYDPDTKKFYIVLVPTDETMLDVMSAHELTHALDDQYFDLGAYTEDASHTLSSDAEQARRFVAEGEATLVMMAFQAKAAEGKDIFAPENHAASMMLIQLFSAIDSAQVAKMAADNPAVVEQMGPDLKASIEAMKSIPPFILDPLFGAYTKGAAAVAAVQEAGGWDAVGALYTNSPESTEQMLHPKEKLITKRDHPIAITFLPLPKAMASWTELDSDVVGELSMAVYFKNIKDKDPAGEVTGWGGDRYVGYDTGTSVVGCWATTWDTDKDARRFFAAYTSSLPKRFGAKTPWNKNGSTGIAHGDGTVTAATLGQGRAHRRRRQGGRRCFALYLARAEHQEVDLRRARGDYLRLLGHRQRRRGALVRARGVGPRRRHPRHQALARTSRTPSTRRAGSPPCSPRATRSTRT